MALTISDLQKMGQPELDALFSASPPGPIPEGSVDGTAIIAPGSPFTADIARMINIFAWQGKVFDAASGLLRNRILPFGINAIIARVYKGESWFDGNECIVLDYSETSTVAQWVRDEIRLVSPGLYLGKVYWNRARLLNFALQSPARTS